MGSSHCGAAQRNPNSIHEGLNSKPRPGSVGRGSSIAMSCGIGRRCSSDPKLLWLWRRTAATALIAPPPWDPPCSAPADLKIEAKNKKELHVEEPYLRM